MDYRVINLSSGEDEDSTEAHVFARAYREAWRAIYGSEPAGRHQVAALGFVVHFAGRTPARVGTAQADTAPAAEDVPPGERHDN
jgi:hypothetical protein